MNTVAHELRMPLASLGMALHLALDERVRAPVNARLSERLVSAREDVGRLRTLIEDLLDLSRVQAGGVGLRKARLPLTGLLRDVAAAVRAEAETRRVTVEVEGPAVEVDRAQMQVALTNLAVNAARHTREGTRVTLRARAQGGGSRWRTLATDVPVGERERIFEPFVRGPGEDRVGAGLGLADAREVVRAHGGRIGVEERNGGGARFWVEVPG